MDNCQTGHRIKPVPGKYVFRRQTRFRTLFFNRLQFTVFTMLVPLLLWTTGCGDSTPEKRNETTGESKSPATEEKPSQPQTADKPGEPTSAQDIHAATTTPADDKSTDQPEQPEAAGDKDSDRTAAETPSETGKSQTQTQHEEPDIADLKNALGDIRDLRRRGEFHQAYRKAQQTFQAFYDSFRTKKPFKQLRALRGQLAREQRVVARLQELGSDREPRREMARKKFKRNRDLARILLRKAVREGTPRAVLTAVDILRKDMAIETPELNACAERALRTEQEQLQTTLLNAIHANTAHVTPGIIISLSRRAGRAAPESALHNKVQNILTRVAAQTVLNKDDMRRIYEKVKADTQFTWHLLVSYLAHVYRVRTEVTERTAFNILLGDSNALDVLRRYAKEAAKSDRKQLTAWGQKYRAILAPLDLRELLIAGPPEGNPLTSGHENEYEGKRSAGASLVADGTAYRFSGESGGGENAVSFGHIEALERPATFTVCFAFKRTTDHNQDTNHQVSNVMVAQSSDDANDNLEIGTDGESLEVYLDTPSEDTTHILKAGIKNDMWYHLALTYNAEREQAARVYLNGEKIECDLPWTEPLDSTDTSPLTLGNSFHHETPFTGQLADFMLFTRELSSSEVQKIAAQHAVD